VAAGNSDTNASNSSPANCGDVITVSALADFNGLAGGGAAPTCRDDQDDTLADFSNWGSTIEITAPGVCIYSSWKDGGYATASGTSMASPHVAGAAALLASESKPTNRTQALNLRSTLVNAGNLNWTDDSGDGVKERLLDVSNPTTFNPKLIAGGGGGDGDGIAPTVNSVSPDDDATGVAVGSNVTVTFSEPINPDTVTSSTFTLSNGGTVSGVITVAGDGISATFNPTNDLAASTTYTVTVTTGVEDVAGNNLAVNFTSQFTTATSGEPPPSGTSVALEGSSANNGSTWTANVQVTVLNDGSPVSGVNVVGAWSNGATGTDSCTTDASGVCTIAKTGIPKRTGSVTCTVTELGGVGVTGPSIVVNKP
jgi:hypothetical protein